MTPVSSRWMCLTLVLVALAGVARAAPPAPSRSVGDASTGHLDNGRSLPHRTASLRVIGRTIKRGFTYGTEELVRALRGAADEVRAAHPGSVLWVGNLSREGGGDIDPSRSHNSGRDADVAFYMTDAKGAPAATDGLVALHDGAQSRDGRYRLDAARSWAFVRHLITRDDVQLEWAFCARWLREKLLAHARAVESDPALLVRAEVVLKQPSDSSPHHDHLHVRIYCNEPDRLGGCVGYGATWPWVDPHREALDARALELAATVLRGGREGKSALGELAAVRGRAAVPELLHLLEGPDRQLRDGVLRLVWATRATEAAPAIRAALAGADPGVTEPLVAALGALGASEAAPDIARVLLSPAAPASAREAAAHALASMEATRSMGALIEALGDPAAAVRVAAAAALARIGNRLIGGDWARAKEAARGAWQARWRELLTEHGDADRAAWLESGFAEAGFAPRGGGLEARVEALLRAAGEAAVPVSHNAQRELTALIGLDLAPMPPAKAKATWGAVWKEARAAFLGP